ncbi:MAG: glycosyltransferase family 4 protein [Holophaga sp.]|nr:glycosyltransferase family 4 protein [Holophaga sp.]
MSGLRILWVHQEAIPPSKAGPTRSFSLMRELVRRGHTVTILASSFDRFSRSDASEADSNDLREEWSEGVRFIWMKTPPYQNNDRARMKNLLAFAWKTSRLANNPLLGPLDLVVGSSPYPFAAFGAARLASTLKVPFVAEIRDLWPQTLIELGRYKPYHPVCLVLAWMERYLYRQAQCILTPLKDIADHVHQHGGHGTPVQWIPNGVDFSLFQTPQAPPRQGPLTVLYAGAMNLGNDLGTLLGTAALLQEEVQQGQVLFRFLGDGPEREQLRTWAAAHHLSGVAFDPPVSKAALGAELAKAHILWAAVRDLPLYRKGLALNKFFDYMAAGRPILFAGPQSEINPIVLADSGICVPAGEPKALAATLRRLLSLSPEARQAMGLRGRTYVQQHHDFSQIAQDLVDALQRVADIRCQS